MSDSPDVASPGGWLQTYGVRVARSIVVGTVGVLAAFQIYGSFNGRQASQFAEIALSPVTKSGAQIGSWCNPLSQSGFVIADNESYVFTNTVPSPASKLIIGVGAKTSTGRTIAEIKVNAANTVYTLLGSGAMKLPGRIAVNPGQCITFGWYAGSGQTTGGVSAGFARIKFDPCGTTSFNCH